MITLTVDPADPNLFGGEGSNASPFVIAFKNAGIPAMAHITNAVIFVSVISTGSVSGYGGSRMLMGLAHVGMNHKVCLFVYGLSSFSSNISPILTTADLRQSRQNGPSIRRLHPNPRHRRRVSLPERLP